MKPVSKELIISGYSVVRDIQKAFNSHYPFLKIEFSTNPKGVFSLKKHMVSPESSMSKITHLPTPIQLNVAEYRTVAEVEKDCTEFLGLSMQVFRKSGNVWNVISLTDSWTLESQNNAGEFISTEMAAAS
ncbi:MAG: hypothetical protein JWQ40_35 [Segetibacter sp.]|nr:hypothetical protein [Segetibacter sp.]